MKVKINNTRYKIIEVDKVTIEGASKESVFFGCCDYETETISLLRTLSTAKKKDTLAHELGHAFLFENGHTDEKFTLEQVCDLFGAYWKDINNIINKYFKEA